MPEKALKRVAGLLLVCLLFVLSGTGCATFQPDQGLAAPAEELDERLVEANNSLGFNVFHELVKAENDNENIFISPASILTALAMTYNGAEGDTRTAMKETLQLTGMSREEINEAFADLLTILNNPDPDVELAVANSLWAREGIDFYDDFLQRSREYFNAEISALDFDDPSSADTINSWVDEQTRGAIEEIVEPPINPLTVLFLINAIYFKGEWSEPFDPERTRDIPFTLPDGSRENHPVMFREDDFSSLENDLFQAAKLPYGENERVSMYLFLPAQEVGLTGFYDELNAENWAAWINSFTTVKGEIGLPRFKFEYDTSLNDVLKTLGMGIAFDDTAADFSAMRSTPPRLFISDVVHKSFVEVNEEGTEAAAATSVEIRLESAFPGFQMIIDRPFFFAITDDRTGTILFMGSVLDPR